MLKINDYIQWLTVLSLFVLLISGCSAVKTKSGSVVEPEIIDESVPSRQNEDIVIVVPAPENKKYISTPVVRGLLIKSRHKFEKGEFVAAANFLERGINITPNNPKLWQRLALIRLEQGDYKQAKQLATKSNILVEGDDELRTMNEKIIQQANQLLGR